MIGVPNSWAETSIFTISRPKQWKTISTKDLTPDGHHVYGANGIIGCYTSFTHEKPTLMITCRGASCGNIHKSLPESYINGNAMTLDNLSSFIHIDYLYYFLKSADFKNVISGSAQPQITQEGLHNLKIIIAPLNEQIRIANKLDSLLAKVDTAQARLERIPTLLKRFRQSVLAAATSGELTREWRECDEVQVSVDDFIYPKSWDYLSIEDIGEVKGGKRLPKGEQLVSVNTGYPYIKAGQLKNGTVEPTEQEYLEAHIQKKIARYIVNKDDAFITIVGACIGDAGLIPAIYDGANLTENAAKICEYKRPLNPNYLSFWLRSEALQKLIQFEIKSGAQGKLALKRIKTLPIPFPSETEQTEIVRRVESLFALADTVEKQYLAAKQRLDRLSQSLLAKAFRGELVPQDPNDEPAAELLKRIQAERQAQPAAKQKRSKPA